MLLVEYLFHLSMFLGCFVGFLLAFLFDYGFFGPKYRCLMCL